MTAYFRLLCKGKNGDYAPLSMREIPWISVGGFCFIVDGKEIPFDWEAEAVNEMEPGVFKYESGYGPFSNDHMLIDVYLEDYKKLGLEIGDITAEFLSKTSKIQEFHINFDTKEVDDVEAGYADTPESSYLVELLNIWISDSLKPDKEYAVSQEVLKEFNRNIK